VGFPSSSTGYHRSQLATPKNVKEVHGGCIESKFNFIYNDHKQWTNEAGRLKLRMEIDHKHN
jgi:hypothetical protein